MKNISDLKYERSWLEIDLGAIRGNIRSVRRRIDEAGQPGQAKEMDGRTAAREHVKIMAVIKTDAYGHGAVAVAEALQTEVDFFGVAGIDEAEELREAGVTLPILILGYTSPADFGRLIQGDIRPAIYHREDAKKLSELACAPGSRQRKAKIHIALDTGMTRIGFAPTQDSVDAICEIASMNGIEIEGLFTHFSCADMTDKAYTKRQMAVYDEFLTKLLECGVHIPLCHIENSAGIMEFTHHRCQMVRSGIVTYGLLPSEEVNMEALSLKPALAWKSRVVDVKTVEAGLGVSYGATYVTRGGERIATVSTGYGDGYPRSLSGKGYVLIRGRRAPILGRVCMDQFMVDVSHIPDVRVEDIVTLIGADGGQTVTAEQIGELSGRFNYELVCDINKRVPRYYMPAEDLKSGEAVNSNVSTDSLT